MAIDPLYIGADMDLGYSGAVPAAGGSYLNSGTCTYELKDSDEEIVASGSLAYVALSDGNYAGVLESTVTEDLTADAPYSLEITFTQAGYNDFRRIPLRAAYRT